MKQLLTAVSILLFSLSATADFHLPKNFKADKRALYHKVYDGYGQTFYTGCTWHKKQVNLESCGLEDSFGRKWAKRARRIEAEHVIPASWLYRKTGKMPLVRSDSARVA